MLNLNLKGKRLYRSPRHAIILGLCAGLGEFLDTDPVFVRLVWLALAAFTHVWPMAVLYGVLFFVVPINPAEESVPSHQEPTDVTPSEPPSRMDGNQNM